MSTDLSKRESRIKSLLSTLSEEERLVLKKSIFDDLELANTLVENAVGYFALPLSFAPGININEDFYPVIPIVIEETSVVAALTKNIELVRENGTVKASTKGQGSIGQIHFSKLSDFDQFKNKLNSQKSSLIEKANHGPAASMVHRGGGVKDIILRRITRPDGLEMGIIHVIMDTVDAMGANIINQTCEYLCHDIEEITGEKALMSILSNLNSEKITTIEITLNGVDADLAHRIAEASLVAQLDPYRAVTHNKGIMNGMDAVCIATGNDWRALEAGVHGYAVRDGQYRGISTWIASGTQLIGKLEAPISVGIVGGVTKVHPIAALAMKCMQVKSAQELSYIMGAVGLIQNLAALRALVTEGISKGHMRLHFKNLIKQTDASAEEQQKILQKLEEVFKNKRYVTATDVRNILKELRS